MDCGPERFIVFPLPLYLLAVRSRKGERYRREGKLRPVGFAGVGSGTQQTGRVEHYDVKKIEHYDAKKIEYYGVKKKYLTAVMRELMMDESAERTRLFSI